MSTNSVVDKLISLPAFDHSKATDELFVEAIREAWEVHFKGSEGFANYCFSQGYESSILPSSFELNDLPFIHVDVFRQRAMITGSHNDVVLELTSSGTSGKKSRNFLDQLSLDRIKKIAVNVYDGLSMVDLEQKVNYICFSYDPVKANDLGTAFTDDLLTSFTAINSVFYAISWSDEKDDFFFDIEQTIRKIDEFAGVGKPVRFLGFPAFIYRLLQLRKERSLPKVDFGSQSWAMTGGGWKTFENQAIPRDEFAKLMEDDFGILTTRVRDLFGMVEHGVPYVQCERGSFHIPIYSVPIIRHPLTLKVQPDGEPGLLQLITPYWTSYPALSILTGDVARIDGECSCGRKGKTLAIVGRGGVKKHKGCAISAAELLK